jgi:hypothetical protein
MQFCLQVLRRYLFFFVFLFLVLGGSVVRHHAYRAFAGL